VGEVAQVGVCLLRLLARLTDQRPGLIVLRTLSQLERDDRVDESLLRTIVQVAHDATALLVGGGHDPGAGGSELGSHRRVRHRGRDKFGEAGQAFLGVGAEWLALRPPAANVEIPTELSTTMSPGS
jgi:hypothetical protein